MTTTPTHLACYWRNVGLCEIRSEYVANEGTSVLEVAMTLMHEGTHARLAARQLHRRGLSLAREERLAIRTEMALALRVPGGETVLADAQRRRAWPDSVYATNHMLQRRLLAGVQLGIPVWLIRAMANRRGIELNPDNWVDRYASEGQRRRVASLRDGPSFWFASGCYLGWTAVVMVASPRLATVAAPIAPILMAAGWAAISIMLKRSRLAARETGGRHREAAD